jgi:hypothetical protein
MQPSQCVECLRHWSRRHVVGGLSVGVLLAGCSREVTPASAAIDVTDADYGKDFRLQDTSGQWRTLADYRGKLVLGIGVLNALGEAQACPMPGLRWFGVA